MKIKASPAAKTGKNLVKLNPQAGKQIINVDPELLKRINAVAAGEEPVDAVLMLRPDDPAQISASPEKAEEIAHKVLRRVGKSVGSEASQVNVFRNLGILSVLAKPDFLRELIKQPEIASAMAHGEPNAYIAPRDVEPVKPDSSRGWATPEPDEKPQKRSKTSRPSTAKGTRKATVSGKSGKPGKAKK